MKASLKLKALVAGAAMIAAGSAFADMSLDSSATGSIFVNLFDSTTNTSFVYDTGLNQNTFDGTNSSVNVNLASDANWVSFVNSVTGGNLTTTTDSVSYNVVSASSNAAFSTSGGTPSGVFNSKLNGGVGFGAGVAQAANTISSSTTNSAYATSTNGNPAGGAVWTNADGSWSSDLKVTPDASLGTALAFYSETYGSTNHQATNVRAIINQFANTWLLDSSGNLTYNATTSSVPVPAPFGLLIAGLALMGIIARRGKNGDRGFGGFAA
ncbi:MAG: VPLPA-CTERM sorting domain-containing protein [Nevskia sp.]|nr:VPLPA-CTERM sorting domain-containing protein [Nevskia sp.]